MGPLTIVVVWAVGSSRATVVDGTIFRLGRGRMVASKTGNGRRLVLQVEMSGVWLKSGRLID